MVGDPAYEGSSNGCSSECNDNPQGHDPAPHSRFVESCMRLFVPFVKGIDATPINARAAAKPQ